jgi:hypothetical protein
MPRTHEYNGDCCSEHCDTSCDKHGKPAGCGIYACCSAGGQTCQNNGDCCENADLPCNMVTHTCCLGLNQTSCLSGSDCCPATTSGEQAYCGPNNTCSECTISGSTGTSPPVDAGYPCGLSQVGCCSGNCTYSTDAGGGTPTCCDGLGQSCTGGPGRGTCCGPLIPGAPDSLWCSSAGVCCIEDGQSCSANSDCCNGYCNDGGVCALVDAGKGC